MGDMGAGASAPTGASIGAEGLQVPTGGTKRDFGNMLNAHMPRRKTLHTSEAGFSPWTKMNFKQEKMK